MVFAFYWTVLPSCTAPGQAAAPADQEGKAGYWDDVGKDALWAWDEQVAWWSNGQCTLELSDIAGATFTDSDDPDLPFDPPLLDYAEPHVVVTIVCRAIDADYREVQVPIIQLTSRILGPREDTVESETQVFNRVQVTVDRLFRPYFDREVPPLVLHLMIASRTQTWRVPASYREFDNLKFFRPSPVADIAFVAFFHEKSALADAPPEAGYRLNLAEYDAILEARGLERTSTFFREGGTFVRGVFFKGDPSSDGFTTLERDALAIGLMATFWEIDYRLPQDGWAATFSAHLKCAVDYWVVGYPAALYWDESCGRIAYWPKTPLREPDDPSWETATGELSEDYMRWFEQSWVEEAHLED